MIFCKADSNAIKAIADEAVVKLTFAEQLYSKKAISFRDLQFAQLTRENMYSASVHKEETAKLAQIEMNMTRIVIQQHEIRSPVSGVLGAIHKRPGEAVRDGETVFEIEVTKMEK